MSDLVYHVYVDRFRRGPAGPWPRALPPVDGGAPVALTSERRLLTGRDQHRMHYGGDLAGVLAALPHLAALGVRTVLLSPIFSSRSSHRYDTDDYAHVDPALGGDAALSALLDALHARDMRLFLDGVFGHTSFEHPWYRDPDLRRRYYRLDGEGQPETWLGWGVMPKLDTDSLEVQEALCQVIDRWRGVDGWRLDAAQHLSDGFLARLRDRLRAHTPGGQVIAEEWEPVVARMRTGHYDGVLNFVFRRALVDFYRGEIAAETLAHRLSLPYLTYPRESWPQLWNLLGNHDTERFFGTHALDVPQLRPALALWALLPGTPHLFQGEELGMRGRNAHVARAPLDWRPGTWHQGVLASYREILAVRRAHRVWETGSVRWVHASNRGKCLAFEREDADVRALVFVNAGDRPQVMQWEGRSITVEPLDARIAFA